MSNTKLPSLHLQDQTISPRYFGFWPGMQDPTDGNTTITDRSGNGRHLAVGANGTYSAVTGTTKYASVVGAAAGQDKSLATTDILTWDMYAGRSIIVAFTANAAAPGATAHLFNARGAAGTVRGMSVVVDSTGHPIVYVNAGGASFASSVPADVVCDSADHVVVVAIDGTSKRVYGWKDGTAWSTLSLGQSVTATSGSTQCDDVARWGAAGDFVAASSPTWVNGATLKLRNMHVMVMDSWPSNYLTLVAELTKNPHRPISARLLP